MKPTAEILEAMNNLNPKDNQTVFEEITETEQIQQDAVRALNKELRDKFIYLFRNALIVYAREQGFKNPHSYADNEIEESLRIVNSQYSKVREEGQKDILKLANELTEKPNRAIRYTPLDKLFEAYKIIKT